MVLILGSDCRSVIGSEKSPMLWYLAGTFFSKIHTREMLTPLLVPELKGFSIPRYYESAPTIQIYDSFHNTFLPTMLSFLNDLVGIHLLILWKFSFYLCLIHFQGSEEAKSLYKHHLYLSRKTFLSRLMEVDAYHPKTSSNAPFALHLALVCHYPLNLNSPWDHRLRSKTRKHPFIPLASLMSEFRLFDWKYPVGEDPQDVYPLRAGLVYIPVNCETAIRCRGYINLFSHLCPFGRLDQLEPDVSPALADSWRVFGKEVYAGAARCSFEYLCGITNVDRSLVSSRQRFSAYTSSLRRNSPWKWRCMFGNGGSSWVSKHYRLVRPLE